MTTFPAVELDADGQAQSILATCPDFAAEIDPTEPEDAIEAARREGFERALEIILVAISTGLEKTPVDRRASAISIRLCSLYIRLGREPMGESTLAGIARYLGVDKSNASRASQRIDEQLPG